MCADDIHNRSCDMQVHTYVYFKTQTTGAFHSPHVSAGHMHTGVCSDECQRYFARWVWVVNVCVLCVCGGGGVCVCGVCVVCVCVVCVWWWWWCVCVVCVWWW